VAHPGALSGDARSEGPHGEAPQKVYAVAAALSTGAHTSIDVYVHPRSFARGVGSHLAELAEREARRRGLEKIQNAALGNDERGRSLLESRGYRVIEMKAASVERDLEKELARLEACLREQK